MTRTGAAIARSKVEALGPRLLQLWELVVNHADFGLPAVAPLGFLRAKAGGAGL